MPHSITSRLVPDFALSTASAVLDLNGIFAQAQPIYDANKLQVEGFEILARREGENGQIISPADFIPDIESQHLTLELDILMLEQACAKIHAMKMAQGDSFFDGKFMSVNFYPNTLAHEDFVPVMWDILSEYGVAAQNIKIEILEHTFRGRDVDIYRNLELLRENEHPIVLDDLGAGFSDLKRLDYLFHLVTGIKLDKSLLDWATKHTKIGALWNKAFREKDRIVEGVETDLDYATAINGGGTHIQGYLLGRPLSLDLITDLLTVPNQKITPPGFPMPA